MSVSNLTERKTQKVNKVSTYKFPNHVPDIKLSGINDDWRRGFNIGEIFLYAIKNPRTTGADVTVLCGSEKHHVLVHSTYMKIISPFFISMYENALKNTAEGEMVYLLLPGVSAAVFRLLLSYMYSWSKKMDLETAITLFPVAMQFDISDVVDCCIHTMETKMDKKNAIKIYLYALRLPSSKLLTLSIRFIQRNTNRVLESEALRHITRDDFESLLKVKLDHQDDLYATFAIRWACFNTHAKNWWNLQSSLKGELLRHTLGGLLETLPEINTVLNRYLEQDQEIFHSEKKIPLTDPIIAPSTSYKCVPGPSQATSSKIIASPNQVTRTQTLEENKIIQQAKNSKINPGPSQNTVPQKKLVETKIIQQTSSSKSCQGPSQLNTPHKLEETRVIPNRRSARLEYKRNDPSIENVSQRVQNISVRQIIMQYFNLHPTITVSMQKIKVIVGAQKSFKAHTIRSAVAKLVSEKFLSQVSGIGGIGSFTLCRSSNLSQTITREQLLALGQPKVVLRRM